MAVLTGIINENEFYSHHYLDAILHQDIKDVVKRWKEREEETGYKSPPKAIASLKGAIGKSWLRRGRSLSTKLNFKFRDVLRLKKAARIKK